MTDETMKIPCKGTIYAVTRKKVIYMKYDGIDSVGSILREIGCDYDIEGGCDNTFSKGSNELLELHMFDGATEYRVVYSRKKGYSTYFVDDSTYSASYKYAEKVLVRYTGVHGEVICDGMVNIVNYVEYDENDIMRITNYRLEEIE